MRLRKGTYIIRDGDIFHVRVQGLPVSYEANLTAYIICILLENETTYQDLREKFLNILMYHEGSDEFKEADLKKTLSRINEGGFIRGYKI